MDMERDYLLLDGDCGLCNRLAIFLDKRLAKGMDIAYRPILSEDGQELIATFPQKQQSKQCLLFPLQNQLIPNLYFHELF